jgi:hypothetical protein
MEITTGDRLNMGEVFGDEGSVIIALAITKP